LEKRSLLWQACWKSTGCSDWE